MFHRPAVFTDAQWRHHSCLMFWFRSCSGLCISLPFSFQTFFFQWLLSHFAKWISHKTGELEIGCKSLLSYHLYFLDWFGHWDIGLQLYHLSFPRMYQHGHAFFCVPNRSLRNYLSPLSQHFTIRNLDSDNLNQESQIQIFIWCRDPSIRQ